MTSSEDMRRELIFAAKFSIYSNSILVALKLTVGLFTMSISVISEAVHSGTDLLAAFIANYSVRKSTRPADDTHKFGHGKYESLSGAIEATLILVAAGIIIYESIWKLIEHSEVQIIEAGIFVMGISALLNFFVSRYLMRIAKKHNSLALEADALHLKTDVWTSIGVFAGLIVVRVTNINEIDPLAALFVAAIIIHAALMLTRRSTIELLDHSLTQEEERIILATIKEVVGEMASYHGLRTRRSGRDRFVDFHLVVPKHLEVITAHAVCDKIEIRVKEKLPFSNLTIHIEPCIEDCAQCQIASICKGEG
ncbi:MAG: cation diffusion facilitator family transporter [Thermoplasmata archaeon]|nr:cation diffusion facilitator family transporter [Thermoplasmata archaeon]